jgi:integration host factor subunit alpha
MPTLAKAQLVETVFSQGIFTKAESAQIIGTLFELIKQTLEQGDDVLITGFGRFCVNGKHQRRGRNPQTGNRFSCRHEESSPSSARGGCGIRSIGKKGSSRPEQQPSVKGCGLKAGLNSPSPFSWNAQSNHSR